jgi:hypothetical protein
MANHLAKTLIDAGLSKSFAYHVVNGAREIGVPLALWLLDNDGIKVGPLAGKTAAEIRLLRNMYAPNAPESVLRRRAANDSQPQERAA